MACSSLRYVDDDGAQLRKRELSRRSDPGCAMALMAWLNAMRCDPLRADAAGRAVHEGQRGIR
jgi:hypothetical protein